MQPYPASIGIHDAGVFIPPPVILVGTTIASERVGSQRLSPWDGETPYQQYQVSVAVENVLRGSVDSPVVKISYMADLRGGGGRPRLGLTSGGGSWLPGDREMFFLRRDEGQLRTICDDFASNCVLRVLSGRHDSVRRRDLAGEMIADVMLSRGSGVSDYQMAEGLAAGATAAFYFAPELSMSKLEELIELEPTTVREEACKLLEQFSLARRCQNDPSDLLMADPEFTKAMSLCPKKKGAGNE